MDQVIYWIGGIGIAIIGYFLKSTIEELKETKKEIERVKDLATENKGKIDLLSNNHSHLVKTLDDLYSMLKDLVIEVKELNKRVK
jgi:septal ring factor EnvC (AmiA/AmiB activator)